MYICLCHAVTEKQIEDAISKGARCLNDLSSELNVADSCGRCRSCARACLKKAKEPNQSDLTNYMLAGLS